MKAKYVNPFTDFGFKKIFGEEASKPLLIDFLKSLLPESNIVDLTFKDKDQMGKTEEDRKAVYDIYCENNLGEKIIVELQKAKQNYFKDRTVYYSTFPIQEQAERGEWNYKLKYVYCVGILDFKFEEKVTNGEGEVIHTVQLKDQNNKVFYEKLKFVYLEMPHFVQAEHDLANRLDKWLYFIKHLEDFQGIPEVFKDEVFIQAFEKAEIAKYSEAERHDYEQSLKVFRDNKAVYEYAVNTAFDEGKIEGKIEVARKMKLKGISSSDISDMTGLSEEEINDL
ncbi:Rpn family recombination-promoting nuclease/putative transposase [Arcicella rigui]|uniref:Rpn family recombination-promoting nuclease/putative transposase n=1 Tax=Arcicella rigui TaxID=797020 RepID=A0ABU5Q904_9BACT|nr:Rpn family recombination-promoting nuclease/putative transposase [Arcicella rigui]MEA5139223.1 Rpn family recombination-promoting nuclease/putative transposase [Arcicella rigui]